MSWEYFLPYVLVMAVVTYLIRMLPLAAFRRRINSRFIRSFLYYVPYAVLSAMTFPAILYATGSLPSACAALAVALGLAWIEKSLLTVAIAASAAAFAVQVIVSML
ncbi:MAG: AzlD domain-containing protein [Clostridia bacterium]|nr:AzlD domain-containing protein [Clostridia bacterium]